VGGPRPTRGNLGPLPAAGLSREWLIIGNSKQGFENKACGDRSIMTHLIRQMGHVAFTVPNPDVSAGDLVEVTGLKIAERRNGTVYLSAN